MTEPREPGAYQPDDYQSGSQYQPSSDYQPGSQYQPDSQYQPGSYPPGSDYQFGSDYQHLGGYQPNKQDQPAENPHRGRNTGWLIVAGVLVLIVVVALVNARRGGNSTALPGPRPTSGIQLSPSTPVQPGDPAAPRGLGGERLPSVSCPQIRDEQAHLAYTCIENALAQDDSNTYLNLRIVLNEMVETNWVISEGSGDANAVVQSPSAGVIRFHQEPAGASVQQVMAKVRQRTASAVQNAYGDEPTSRTIGSSQRVFSGVLGYELVTEISINQAYRQANDLKASKERLWVVGIPTSAGVSIFMMSIPDDRSDLWPRAEATVGSLHVI
jgi:hypothetical protein